MREIFIRQIEIIDNYFFMSASYYKSWIKQSQSTDNEKYFSDLVNINWKKETAGFRSYHTIIPKITNFHKNLPSNSELRS